MSKYICNHKSKDCPECCEHSRPHEEIPVYVYGDDFLCHEKGAICNHFLEKDIICKCVPVEDSA